MVASSRPRQQAGPWLGWGIFASGKRSGVRESAMSGLALEPYIFHIYMFLNDF